MNVPITYSYWIIPGRLLAGEYPIAKDPVESREKLTALKRAGITCFIDLTTPEDGLLPYEDLLRQVYDDIPTSRYSFPISDFSIPDNRGTMQNILDAIDFEISAGRNLYVHCWGGIGRTGTVIGCYIARHGGNHDPLTILAEMWKTNPKSSRYPESPQTPEQMRFVREWNDQRMLVSRARGALFGQLAGDSLGSLVEFQTPHQIASRYPGGVRDLEDGGTFDTIAGQPTDDSEMALLLARMLADGKGYNAKKALDQYRYWLNSGPFDCGNTIRSALQGYLNHESQANGALMRISPVGIFGGGILYREEAPGPEGFREKWGMPLKRSGTVLEQVASMARDDAGLTHPHTVCLQANELFAMAISRAVASGVGPEVLYREVLGWAAEDDIDPMLIASLKDAADQPPRNFMDKMGWVLIAFQNAFYQLIHASDPETGIVDTIMHGGDTDTNAAICGALLGAVHGIEVIPERWIETISNCRPERGRDGVKKPRSAEFWPVDAMELAVKLVGSKPG